jgi:hypothetical protein
MKIVKVKKYAGTFAENKDVARDLRVKRIMPALKKDEEITLDFDQVTSATQSFVHALISEPMRQYRDRTLDLILFKNCSPTVKEIINTVTEYMQES